jgi:hypothetical protein
MSKADEVLLQQLDQLISSYQYKNQKPETVHVSPKTMTMMEKRFPLDKTSNAPRMYRGYEIVRYVNK